MFRTLDTTRTGKLNLASNSSTVVEGKSAIRLPINVNNSDKLIELQNTFCTGSPNESGVHC